MIFQALLDRMMINRPLEDAVAEVSRYGRKKFEIQWGQFVREHPNIPDEVLKILAQNEDWWVRWYIAQREQDLPEDVLKTLAQDGDWAVRRAVAYREQNLPKYLLKILSQDNHWAVRWEVAQRKQDLPLENPCSS